MTKNDLDKYVEDDNKTYEILDKTPEECEEILNSERERLKNM